MSTFDRAAARARVEEATPGPWPYTRHEVMSGFSTKTHTVHRVEADNGILASTEGDAEFIAHARTDLPAALDILDAVLALHPVGPVAILGRGFELGCQACRTEGACPTRLAIEGGER